jgi:hypothetical protein
MQATGETLQSQLDAILSASFRWSHSKYIARKGSNKTFSHATDQSPAKTRPAVRAYNNEITVGAPHLISEHCIWSANVQSGRQIWILPARTSHKTFHRSLNSATHFALMLLRKRTCHLIELD